MKLTKLNIEKLVNFAAELYEGNDTSVEKFNYYCELFGLKTIQIYYKPDETILKTNTRIKPKKFLNHLQDIHITYGEEIYNSIACGDFKMRDKFWFVDPNGLGASIFSTNADTIEEVFIEYFNIFLKASLDGGWYSDLLLKRRFKTAKSKIIEMLEERD